MPYVKLYSVTEEEVFIQENQSHIILRQFHPGIFSVAVRISEISAPINQFVCVKKDGTRENKLVAINPELLEMFVEAARNPQYDVIADLNKQLTEQKNLCNNLRCLHNDKYANYFYNQQHFNRMPWYKRVYLVLKGQIDFLKNN